MKTVIEMAREAGAVFPADGSYHKFEFEGSLERFAALVIANHPPQSYMTWQEGYEAGKQAEREACAKVCEGWDFVPGGHEFTPQQLTKNLTNTIATNIRARGNHCADH